ncbi:MAG: AAA family ATPase [Chitinophagaceae bacterium]
MEAVIGRDEEKTILTEALLTDSAELIAVFGRRRIGKTYLIRNHYKDYLKFELTGIHDASLKEQLHNFSRSLQESAGLTYRPSDPASWLEAFEMLSDHLKKIVRKSPVVILIDELPWLCTPRSGFLQAFGHWWNTSASRIPQLKVVICGSAASWMIRQVINDRGGLHNRVTRRIRLLPFTLHETKAFLEYQRVKLDDFQVLQLYMAMGGVPHYLKHVQKGQSAAQIVDKLFFSKQGILKTEFSGLYRSLFANASNHEAVVRALARKPEGLNRAEIIAACGFTTGGWTTALIEELEQSGFITQYIPFGRTQRDAIYKLSDEYSLFYLKFVESAKSVGPGSWLRIARTARFHSWAGFAFEAVCQKHVDQIKKALGISGVYTETSAWRHTGGAQIDMLLDRADHCINLCEMKFSEMHFTISKKYAAELDRKVQVFREQTGTRKSIFLTMVSSYGTVENEYYLGRVVTQLTMADLFKA